MLTLLKLFTSIISVYSVSSFTYKSCGTPTDIAQNLELDIDPKLPEINYKLYLNADFSKEVTGGSSKYTITYNFIPLSPSVNDLCTEIASSNITCPLSNHISSESKGTIPSGLSGSTTIKNEWFNFEGERILCMQFNIKT